MREFRVLTEPVIVFARVGKVQSNTFVGSSMVISVLWSALDLQPGDEIHRLPGGLFAVTDDGVWSILFSLEDRPHPFESRHLPPREPDLPGVLTDTPRRADYSLSRAWENTRTMEIAEAQGLATLKGGGLDWLSSQPAT